MGDFINFLWGDGIKEGIKGGSFREGCNIFMREAAVTDWLHSECIEYDHRKSGCTVIWAPSGAGKTFTLCNLMAAESRSCCSSTTKYVRIDWKNYVALPEGPGMLEWMQGQELSAWTSLKWARGFTVFLMDHFDTPMGEKGSEQKNKAIEFIKEMLSLVRRGSPYAMILCVNNLGNATALKAMMSGSKQVPCVRMLPLMIWTSEKDARFFATSAWDNTAPEIRETLRWGDGHAPIDDEEAVGNLAQLILCSGCVKSTVIFLQGNDFTEWIELTVRGLNSKKQWEEKINQFYGKVDTSRFQMVENNLCASKR